MGRDLQLPDDEADGHPRHASLGEGMSGEDVYRGVIGALHGSTQVSNCSPLL